MIIVDLKDLKHGSGCPYHDELVSEAYDYLYA